MFSLKHSNLNRYTDLNLNYENCIYSVSNSRPSKSLIDCNLYKEFTKINFNLNILDEFSYCNTLYKNKDNLLINNIINIFKLDNLDINSIVISYDSIIVSEIDNNDIYFCFDNNINLRNILNNLIILVKELKKNDSLIINFSDLYNYPSAELFIILNYLFKKTIIYNCKLIKNNLIYCKEFEYNNDIYIFLKNCLKQWNNNSFIKQFGIYINNDTLNKIKEFNNSILNYYINISHNLVLSSIDEKEYFLKNFIKNNKINNDTSFNCNHIIKEFNVYNCYICSKCHELFQFY
tara:strand:+ start:1849 stop:2721 length:873 start_codon:yes stop_codon:yes gene_type:complete